MLICIIFYAIIIGVELYIVLGFGPIHLLFIHMGYVALGESAVMVGAYILFTLLRKRKDFINLFLATQNVDFKF